MPYALGTRRVDNLTRGPPAPVQHFERTSSANTHVLVGFEGVPLNSKANAAALVLRNLLGGDGSALKWSSDASASR